MTALVVLENISPETVVTVPKEVSTIEGSSIYLAPGEKITVETLLYGLMLESGNDAAYTLAATCSGSIGEFCALMNKKAKDMGLIDTHFTNPHGLHDDNHYTTAYELARIAQAALQNPLLRTIVSTRKTTIPHQDTDGVRLLVNHNKMLRQYDGCIGMKTGYTQKSGRCLVSAAERDGVTLISVTIDSPDDWNDHAKLLDYGFANYRSVELCSADFQLCLPVVGGKETYAIVGISQTYSVTLPTTVGVIEQTVECPRHLYAPVKEGDVCGRMLFLCDTNNDGIQEIIGDIPLIAQHKVEKYAPHLNLWQRFLLWWQRLFS